MGKFYYTKEEREVQYKLSLYSSMIASQYRGINHYSFLLKMLKEGPEKSILLNDLQNRNVGKHQQLFQEKKEEKKDYLKDAVRWYRCKNCGEWVPETSYECAKCGRPFDARLENQEIEIILEIEPLPGAPHLSKKLMIKPKTSVQAIVSKLVDEGIINAGDYYEVGIIRINDAVEVADNLDDKSCWKQYPDYQAGDIVFLNRRLSYTEISLAHLSYIEETYSHAQLFTERNLTIVMAKDQGPSITKHIQVLGCSGKAGVINALGIYSAKFENYPQKAIPFENSKIHVDAIALELEDKPLVITHYLENYPYQDDVIFPESADLIAPNLETNPYQDDVFL